MVFPMTDRIFSKRDLETLKHQFDKVEDEFGQNHDMRIAFANEMERLLSKENHDHPA